MEITIETSKYITDERMAEIAEEELRRAFQRQFRTEGDVRRVLSNLTYDYVLDIIAEQWDGDFTGQLREGMQKAITDGLQYAVFRRHDSYGTPDSPAIEIMDEEIKNARPLIRQRIEEQIKDYPFHELSEDEIGAVIYEAIMDKLFGHERKESVCGES
ncbi:MAG: hypothetical protein LUF80_00525 [Oscillospiraceae bacterium]|nr:hypothetical protein [Oscillospiraceae bacterium]